MPTKVIMPQMGESIAEGTVVKWLKKVGERVERDEPLLEISTDKVDAEIPSPASGVLTEIVVGENQTIEVNAVLGWIDGEGAGEAAGAVAAEAAAPPPPPVKAEAAPAPAPAAPEVAAAAGGAIRSSPVVQKLAAEHNVDLTKVRGTGEGGRISKKDILDYVSILDEVDTENVAPAYLASNNQTQPREDVIETSVPTDEFLANAPRAKDEYVVIPRVHIAQ